MAPRGRKTPTSRGNRKATSRTAAPLKSSTTAPTDEPADQQDEPEPSPVAGPSHDFQDLPRSRPSKTTTSLLSNAELSTVTSVRPVLHNQLKNHQWTEKMGNAFFDRFFRTPRPGRGLRVLPKKINEKSMIEWVMNSELKSARRFWRSSTTKSMSYDSKSHRLPSLQCDLFTYRVKDEPPTFRWEDVRSIVELKSYHSEDKKISDTNLDYLYQLAQYARAVFGSQPGRLYLHAFIVVQTMMRCWMFTRAGMSGSRALDLTNAEDFKICGRVLHGHVTLSDEDMGVPSLSTRESVTFSPRENLRSGLSLSFPTRTFLLGPLIVSSNAPTIVSRATTAWYAKEAPATPVEEENGEDDISEFHFVVKLSHQYSSLAREGELYQKCKDARVNGVASCYGYKELPSVHDLLGDACQHAGTTLPRKAASRSTATDEGGPNKRQRLSTAVSDLPPPQLTVPDRIPVVLVLDRGIPVREFTSVTDLFAAFRDAIRGHYSLLTAGGILHRDISCNNIMITSDNKERDDHFRGFLIDLDHAIRTDQLTPSGSAERTGTREFMSIRLLDDLPPQHSYLDDLESFLWVFIWVCTAPDMRPGLLWGVTPTELVAGQKRQQIQVSTKFNKLLAGLGDTVFEEVIRSDVLPGDTAHTDPREAARTIVRGIVELLLPLNINPGDASLADPREHFYMEMVSLFNSELPSFKQIGSDWMGA